MNTTFQYNNGDFEINFSDSNFLLLIFWVKLLLIEKIFDLNYWFFKSSLSQLSVTQHINIATLILFFSLRKILLKIFKVMLRTIFKGRSYMKIVKYEFFYNIDWRTFFLS